MISERFSTTRDNNSVRVSHHLRIITPLNNIPTMETDMLLFTISLFLQDILEIQEYLEEIVPVMLTDRFDA